MFTTLAHRNHVYVEARTDLLTRYQEGKSSTKANLVGDCFTNKDFALFTNDSGIKKTNLGLTRRKHNMKFFVSAGTTHRNEGSDELKAAMQERADERLNVMYCSNVTTAENYVPMTSWIMVHRISHTIHASHGYRHLEEQLHFGVYDMLKSMGLIRNEQRMNMDWGINQGGELAQVYNMIMTMRSARLGLIGNGLDYLGEFMAQYQHGGVKLQRSSEWTPRIESFDSTKSVVKQTQRGAKQWLQSFGSATKQFDNFDDRIQEVEDFINDSMGKLFDELMGKTMKF